MDTACADVGTTADCTTVELFVANSAAGCEVDSVA